MLKQATNLRLGEQLCMVLGRGVSVDVSVITEARADYVVLDMNAKALRVLVEHAVVQTEARAGRLLLNLALSGGEGTTA